MGRELEHAQPRLGGGEGAQFRLEVHVQVVPDHADERGAPAPAPGPGAWRPQRLAGFVLEDDPGAEGRRGAFTRGQVSFFHTSTAPSSRSTARRAPSWQLQPRRRSRYQTPGIVYRTLNFAVIRPAIRARVHRWSSQPAAAGPASSSRSSSTSRHRAACPFDARPGAPPACHAARHRCTDRSDAAAQRRSPLPQPAARTSPPPPAGPAPAAGAPQRLNRRPAHASHTVHTAGNRPCQPRCRDRICARRVSCGSVAVFTKCLSVPRAGPTRRGPEPLQLPGRMFLPVPDPRRQAVSVAAAAERHRAPLPRTS
jgi:hypothetical protein